MNPDPDPVCSQRSDPDPVQIGPDPQHCSYHIRNKKLRILNMTSQLKLKGHDIFFFFKKHMFQENPN